MTDESLHSAINAFERVWAEGKECTARGSDRDNSGITQVVDSVYALAELSTFPGCTKDG